MKYRDLIQFDPIESVIQLTSADRPDDAERLVATYVISPNMAERLTGLLIPQVQFDQPADQKGVLIVGNYGTGKSHLLAVLSAVAERADLAAALRDESVRREATTIAGRFKVIRTEIGSTKMTLRDLIVKEIEAAVQGWGIDFRFPTMTQASNSKDAIVDLMVAFQQRFPDQGLLLVVDELLDYLKSRDEQAIILDLGFLREIGEVCRDTRLRFIGGVQESLFDSPSFQFVASAVQRVKDRFEQVRIAREDVSYVVAQRLLRKNDQQRATITRYLEPFAALYPAMAERMPVFVNLFPVHPAYIETFEALRVVEKREVLKTLSGVMHNRLDDDVPADHPGLITYDSYWDKLRSDPVFRSIPDVREVLDKSDVLEAKVQAAYTRPATKPVALRIIHALSVHRLTTDDLKAPIGVTAQELRDTLCLSVANLPEYTADFLGATVETALKEISRTVNGQFLSFNPQNGQWYLDVAKDVDYDALIDERAATRSNDRLNQAYYDALARLLEVADVHAHVPGFRIWEYEVEWSEKKVTRPGYLFFGAANDRSTAQPPRDFYLYFLRPFGPPSTGDEQRPDEVTFRLAKHDSTFEQALRRYSAAMALADSAPTNAKAVYRDKALGTNPQRPGYLQQVIRWLQDQAASGFEVTYQGATRPMTELLTSGAPSVKELVDRIASDTLAARFRDALPDEPAFSVRITRENRQSSAAEAVRYIAGVMKTRQGAAILDGLGLLEGDALSVGKSRYARHIRDELKGRGEGKVLNRADLIVSTHNGLVEYDRRFHLEPEWIAVLLVALVHAGELTIALPGKKIDAASLDQASQVGVEALSRFTYVEAPKGLPVAALTALFDLLSLPLGLIKDAAKHQDAVEALQKEVASTVEGVVTLRARVADGIACWGATVVEGAERDDLLGRLDGYRAFLDSLRSINTPGKLKNFGQSVEQVQAHGEARAGVRAAGQLLSLVIELQPVAAYLSLARTALPSDDAVAEEIAALQQQQVSTLRDVEKRLQPGTREQVLQQAKALKARYVDDYVKRHNRASLTMDQDRRRGELLRSPAMLRLRTLRALPILSTAALRGVEQGLIQLRVCPSLVAAELATTPTCSKCGYRPVGEDGQPAGPRLEALERQFDGLEREWTATLLRNLSDPTVRETLGLLAPAERAPIDRFQKEQRLPEAVDGALLAALKSAFSDLERVAISKDDLLASLTEGGAPSTVEGFTARFTALLDRRMAGKNPERVRLVVE